MAIPKKALKPAGDSPLERLPAEIKNRIASLVLPQGERIPLREISKHNSLTKASPKLRKDTASIFWASNHFYDDEPSQRTEISKHATRISDLLTKGLGLENVKQIKQLDLSFEVRTAIPQRWYIMLKRGNIDLGEYYKVTASGEDRISQGSKWIFNRYLNNVLVVYQQAGFQVYATEKFGKGEKIETPRDFMLACLSV